MKLTVLGCQSPAPGPNGATAGYLLDTGNGKLLIDCGSGIYAKLMNYIRIEELDAVLLSHYHHDHVCDMPIVQYGVLMASVMGRGNQVLPVYGPAEPKSWAEKMTYQNYTRLYVVGQGQTIRVAGVEITFYQTAHPPLCHAMHITDGTHTIVYGADSGPDTNWTFAQDCDLFICEGTFTSDRVPTGKRSHLSAREAAVVAAQIKAKRLLITHQSPDIEREQYRRDAASGGYTGVWELAEIGQVIEL